MRSKEFNFYFWSEVEISSKNDNFCQKIENFGQKSKFGNNRKFFHKSKFGNNRKIYHKSKFGNNRKIFHKSKFWSKLEILVK